MPVHLLLTRHHVIVDARQKPSYQRWNRFFGASQCRPCRWELRGTRIASNTRLSTRPRYQTRVRYQYQSILEAADLDLSKGYTTLTRIKMRMSRTTRTNRRRHLPSVLQHHRVKNSNNEMPHQPEHPFATSPPLHYQARQRVSMQMTRKPRADARYLLPRPPLPPSQSLRQL